MVASEVNENIGEYTLMSMLNNCVGGIAVVSINNIYSAACLCLSILSLIRFSS